MLATTSEQADPAQGLVVFLGMFLFATIGVAVIAAIVEPRRRSRLGLPPFAFARYRFGAGFSGGPDEWVTASAKALRAEARLVRERLRGRISTATYQARMADLAGSPGAASDLGP